MNIYDLRKHIHVDSYNTHSNGCSIYYRNKDNSSSIHLGTEDLFKELISIGTYEDNYHDRTEFDDSYNMSQWDAYNIAIRHELMIETEKEIDNSDIGKAIENLKNK